MCDVEGYCYLPLLEETGYIPKHKYSYGAEIRHNIEVIADHYGFRGMFCTKVDNQVWDDAKGHWIVDLTQSLGSVRPPTKLTVKAQVVFMCGGILAIPKVPKLPGFAKFRKSHQVFHTSRWDYTITGGSQEQPDMVNLQDKTVAIIGTGATSVQTIPHIAKWARHLYVVQRTPSYCGERGQKETTPEDWA
jgi:cation diffusion facilitator CzcD-associated flavoprotein CzcO